MLVNHLPQSLEAIFGWKPPEVRWRTSSATKGLITFIERILEVCSKEFFEIYIDILFISHVFSYHFFLKHIWPLPLTFPNVTYHPLKFNIEPKNNGPLQKGEVKTFTNFGGLIALGTGINQHLQLVDPLEFEGKWGLLTLPFLLPGVAFGFGLHGPGDTGALGIFRKMLFFGALGIAISWLQATWWKHLAGWDVQKFLSLSLGS